VFLLYSVSHYHHYHHHPRCCWGSNNSIVLYEFLARASRLVSSITTILVLATFRADIFLHASVNVSSILFKTHDRRPSFISRSFYLPKASAVYLAGRDYVLGSLCVASPVPLQSFLGALSIQYLGGTVLYACVRILYSPGMAYLTFDKGGGRYFITLN
jgi:hypothetical protein